jgi:hypothetical protein
VKAGSLRFSRWPSSGTWIDAISPAKFAAKAVVPIEARSSPCICTQVCPACTRTPGPGWAGGDASTKRIALRARLAARERCRAVYQYAVIAMAAMQSTGSGVMANLLGSLSTCVSRLDRRRTRLVPGAPWSSSTGRAVAQVTRRGPHAACSPRRVRGCTRRRCSPDC